MSFELVFTPRYQRIEKRFLKRHPELRRLYRKTLQLQEADPFHSALRLHPLKRRLTELHSVSINLSYHITLELISEDKRSVPVNVADHGENARKA